jgi:hypothetical protein
MSRIKIEIKKAKPEHLGKFKSGVKVKVFRVISDSEPVLNMTGTIVSMEREGGQILVRFPFYTQGHGAGYHEWYVDSKALKVVK